MDELNLYLQQLPNFLHSELASHVGNLSGVDQIGIVDRYWSAANQLILSKRAPLRQDHIDNAQALWNGLQSTKEDMENRKLLQGMPGNVGTDFFSMTIAADFVLQSIRFLTDFRARLEALSVRLKEQQRQHVQRQAEEAARRRAEEAARAHAQAREAARIQAEEAALAKAQAEEAARRLAEEQAAQQQAREAALQLAQRQVEEAARLLAQRQADEKAARKAPDAQNPVGLIAGPEATFQIKAALDKLRAAIEGAVEEFAGAIGSHDLSEQQLMTIGAIKSV